MQFTTAFFAAVALAVANAVEFTMGPAAFQAVQAGETFEITWQNATGPVTILLKDGLAGNLQTVSTIASGLTGTSYSWSIPSSQMDDTYALEITDSTGTPNYSVQFILTGGSASSSISGSATATPSPSGSATTKASATTTTPGSSTSGTPSSSSSGSSSTTTAPTTSGNSTTSASSTSKSSASKTSTTTTGTSSATSAPNSGSGAANLASPIAFVVLAFAAIMTFN